MLSGHFFIRSRCYWVMSLLGYFVIRSRCYKVILLLGHFDPAEWKNNKSPMMRAMLATIFYVMMDENVQVRNVQSRSCC